VVLDQDGARRDVSAFVRDFDAGFLELDGIAGLRRWFRDQRTALPGGARQPARGPPIADIPFVCAVGLNYADRARNPTGRSRPSRCCSSNARPACAAPTTTCRCRQTPPPWITRSSFGLVVAKRASRVDEAEAAQADRRLHHRRRRQRTALATPTATAGSGPRARAMSRWCPTGPMLVTPDQIADPLALTLELDVNGQPRQRGTSAADDLRPRPHHQRRGQHLALPAGTLIPTGTPPGVAIGMKPRSGSPPAT